MIKREKKKKKKGEGEGEEEELLFFVLPPGDVYQERHGGSDMKGIQVSIDVSESEIVPKAFQRPAVSGVRARGASASVCSLAARRKKKKKIFTQAGRSTEGARK